MGRQVVNLLADFLNEESGCLVNFQMHVIRDLVGGPNATCREQEHSGHNRVSGKRRHLVVVVVTMMMVCVSGFVLSSRSENFATSFQRATAN